MEPKSLLQVWRGLWKRMLERPAHFKSGLKFQFTRFIEYCSGRCITTGEQRTRKQTGATTTDHAPYAKRALAYDQVEAMAVLGFEAFAVCGHDRGARCAYRLALDAPRAVTRLAVLDVVPTGDVFGRADKNFALSFWLWWFLAAPYDLPECLLGCDPDALLDHALEAWAEEPDAFPAEVRAEYARTLRNPGTIHAICEEYRTAATLDCEHDEADRGRRKISCPVLTLWSHDGAVANWCDPLEVWRA